MIITKYKVGYKLIFNSTNDVVSLFSVECTRPLGKSESRFFFKIFKIFLGRENQ